jgi:hypothetical protein
MRSVNWSRLDQKWIRLISQLSLAPLHSLLWDIAALAGESGTPRKTETLDSSTEMAQVAEQTRSLAMLSQVVMQLEHYVRNKDLSAIHNEDVILSAAATELFSQAGEITSNQGKDFKTNLTTFCSRVSALHLAADLNQQANSEMELGKVLESFAKVKAHFRNRSSRPFKLILETFTCPMHRDVVGKRTDFCRNVEWGWIS